MECSRAEGLPGPPKTLPGSCGWEEPCSLSPVFLHPGLPGALERRQQGAHQGRMRVGG